MIDDICALLETHDITYVILARMCVPAQLEAPQGSRDCLSMLF